MTRACPDWLNGFPKRFQDDVIEAIDAKDHSRIVAFGADNTLWKNSIGEFFLQVLTQSEDPEDMPVLPPQYWSRYEEIAKDDRIAACGHAVQCMAGLEYGDVAAWVDLVASKWPHYSAKMADLINGMRDEGGLQVHVVSACNSWLLRRALFYMGVEVDGAYGIETEMDSIPGVGLVLSDRLVQPVTCNGGKVEVLDQHVGLPSFVIGNGLGDHELMDVARWRLVIGEKGCEDNEMMKLARERGWNTWKR